MALQGVNIALMPLGAEAAWARTMQDEFGLDAGALAGFFAGPAFLAWGRMGNIQGWVLTRARAAGGRERACATASSRNGLRLPLAPPHPWLLTPPCHTPTHAPARWGGPLPEEYVAKQLALGRRVVGRMRELGIAPVLPGFAGERGKHGRRRDGLLWVGRRCLL
jgi:hypothetical protein